MNKPYSVLLVDDDKFLLGMYQKKFEKYGVNADMCVGPEEALSKLRAGGKYDILVLDIIMPGMDGLELLKAIRQEKLSEKSLVVMLTNESASSKIEEAKNLGVAGYIVKATSIPSEVVEEIIKIADRDIK
ncbi:response regulator [Candidatus Parcubacteria bacterium]|nr:response regulator [Candidatus Parcubacteria bacterium]